MSEPESLLFQVAASKQARVEALIEENADLRARAERAEAERDEMRNSWAVTSGQLKASRRHAEEYRERAERAEAELLRVRSVVDAAEALVEHWGTGEKDSSGQSKHLRLLRALDNRVVEAREAAQR